MPTGLEIRLPIDGTGERVARIPNPWQLQLYLGDGEGFFRGSVRRTWTVPQIVVAIARDKSIPRECISLSLSADEDEAEETEGGEDENASGAAGVDGSTALTANDLSMPSFDGGSTVESLQLFRNRHRLVAVVNRTSSTPCLCAGAVKCAHAKRLYNTCLREKRGASVNTIGSSSSSSSSSRDAGTACDREKANLADCNSVCGVKSDAQIAAEKLQRKEAKAKAKAEAKAIAAMAVAAASSTANNDHAPSQPGDDIIADADAADADTSGRGGREKARAFAEKLKARWRRPTERVGEAGAQPLGVRHLGGDGVFAEDEDEAPNGRGDENEGEELSELFRRSHQQRHDHQHHEQHTQPSASSSGLGGATTASHHLPRAHRHLLPLNPADDGGAAVWGNIIRQQQEQVRVMERHIAEHAQMQQQQHHQLFEAAAATTRGGGGGAAPLATNALFADIGDQDEADNGDDIIDLSMFVM